MKTTSWKIVLGFGLPLTVCMIITGALQDGGFTLIRVIFSLFGGIIGGFLFAWSMKYFGKKVSKKLYKETIVKIPPGGKLIKEGAASHFKGKEGVGGKLVLTDKQLVFKSHRYNIQNHEDSFDIQQIEKVQATKTPGMLNNGLTIDLINNIQHRFVVDDPHDWVTEIMNQKHVAY